MSAGSAPLLRAQMVLSRLEGSNPFLSASSLISGHFGTIGALATMPTPSSLKQHVA